MKTKLLFLALFYTMFAVAQIGIGTDNPKATLDVTGKPSETTIVDGIIPPKLTGDELTAKDAVYTTNQSGTVVYITAAATAPSAKTINVSASGFYFFDGTLWNALGNGVIGSPFNLSGTSTDAGNNKINTIARDGGMVLGATTIDPNAILELQSNSKGFILSKLTTQERDAITTPTNGMMIYNTTDACINMYKESESEWKSLCGDKIEIKAAFDVICDPILVTGTYNTGIALDPETNYITIRVNVTELGPYNITTSASGMFFSAIGEFTTLGEQEVTLGGQGFPLIVGLNFIALSFDNVVCTTVINVLNGLANVTGCGTLGTLTGNVYANLPIVSGDVFRNYNPGPAYTGGGVYGITSAANNGIKISQPVNGTFTTTGSPIDYIITGTPLVPGNTTLNYSINGFACSFTVPVQSGTGRASAVACSGTLAGTYTMGSPTTSGHSKQVTLTVSTLGTLYIRTNTVNGYYFAGSATASATGALVVTLNAVGTPISNTTDIFTVTVSSAATTFTTCTFNVVVGLPVTVPDFSGINCVALSNEYTYIKANNTGANDYYGAYLNDSNLNFGKSTKLSADGLTLAVGAVGEDGDLTGGQFNSTNNNTWVNAGAVYIYTRTSLNGAWTFQTKIKPSQLNADDFFGNSLDLSSDGNTLVVGSLNEDGNGTGVNPEHNSSASASGTAYVFSRSGTTWSQQAYLKANNPDASDYFGTNVAISGDGNTVAIGATMEDGSVGGINATDNNLAASAGAVYTYIRSGSTWSFDAKIKPTTNYITAGDKRFGVDVALNNDGTTLAVGSDYDDSVNTGINSLPNNSATDAGGAFVFVKNSGVWSQQAYIKANQVNAGDRFGLSLDLDGTGNTLIVGSLGEDGSGAGVNATPNESATNAGAAYVFKRTSSTWSQVAYLKASNTGTGDNFGRSVSISENGEHAVVGAVYEDGTNVCINTAQNNSSEQVGAAYSYSLVGSNWSFAFQFKTQLLNYLDYWGGCVSISSDGKSIAVASGWEDGSGTGVNPANNNSALESGAIIVYSKP